VIHTSAGTYRVQGGVIVGAVDDEEVDDDDVPFVCQ
jgi:hypothetical protein